MPGNTFQSSPGRGVHGPGCSVSTYAEAWAVIAGLWGLAGFFRFWPEALLAFLQLQKAQCFLSCLVVIVSAKFSLWPLRSHPWVPSHGPSTVLIFFLAPALLMQKLFHSLNRGQGAAPGVTVLINDVPRLMSDHLVISWIALFWEVMESSRVRA